MLLKDVVGLDLACFGGLMQNVLLGVPKRSCILVENEGGCFAC